MSLLGGLLAILGLLLGPAAGTGGPPSSSSSTCVGTGNPDPPCGDQMQCYGDSACCLTTGKCLNSDIKNCEDAVECSDGPNECGAPPAFPPSGGNGFNRPSGGNAMDDGCRCEKAVDSCVNEPGPNAGKCWGTTVCNAALCTTAPEDCCDVTGTCRGVGGGVGSAEIPLGTFCIQNGDNVANTFKFCSALDTTTTTSTSTETSTSTSTNTFTTTSTSTGTGTTTSTSTSTGTATSTSTSTSTSTESTTSTSTSTETSTSTATSTGTSTTTSTTTTTATTSSSMTETTTTTSTTTETSTEAPGPVPTPAPPTPGPAPTTAPEGSMPSSEGQATDSGMYLPGVQDIMAAWSGATAESGQAPVGRHVALVGLPVAGLAAGMLAYLAWGRFAREQQEYRRPLVRDVEGAVDALE